MLTRPGALTPLALERGDEAATNPVQFRAELDRLIDMARELGRLDDPVIRDRLVDYLIDIQALNLNNSRRRMAPLNRDRPMGLALMNKLARTELVRELLSLIHI